MNPAFLNTYDAHHAARSLSEHWEPIGRLKIGNQNKIKNRENDPDLQLLMKKHQIEFEQTHKMNSPNVSAAYDAVERFIKKKPANYDRKSFELAWDWVETILHPYWRNSSVVSFDTIRKSPLIETREKSAGLPWNLSGIPFKEEMYEEKWCRDWIEERWEGCLNDMLTLAQVTVKKEILPIKKLAINRLRNVIAVDGAHNMWNQRLTFVMHHVMQNYPIATLTALGWSPYNGGMQDLADWLSLHPHGYEFDGSTWEAHLWEDCLLKIAELKWRALKPSDRTPENRLRFNNVYKMISRCPIVLPDGNVFMKGDDGDGGNLTGQVGTAHDNSLMMLFTIAYAYIRLVNIDYHQFRSLLSIITLGDDCTMTISDKIHEKFNGKSIAKLVYDELSVVLESPSWEPRPFHQLGFLSMHFYWDVEHRQWVHTVDRDKLYSSLLQGGTERTPPEQLQRLCGMRNVAWGNLQMRREIDMLIAEYIDLYDKSFKSHPDWVQANKSYVNDRLLERLYFGFHSVDFDHTEFHCQSPRSQGVGQ